MSKMSNKRIRIVVTLKVNWAKLPCKLGEIGKQNRRNWFAISPVLKYV